MEKIIIGLSHNRLPLLSKVANKERKRESETEGGIERTVLGAVPLVGPEPETA